MKKLLPLIVVLLVAMAGGGSGYFLKSNSKPISEIETDTAPPDHEKAAENAHKKKKKKTDSHGKGQKETSSYMKFSRQFVVPVVKNGELDLMMILDINIEIDPARVENTYSYEPLLRDAMLAELFVLAGNGYLTEITENPEAMAHVKGALLETAISAVGDGAKSILILDIGLQKY